METLSRTPQKPQPIARMLHFLLLLAALFTIACERTDPMAEDAAIPAIQEAEIPRGQVIIGPNGPCEIDWLNTSFDVNNKLDTAFASLNAFDFAVELKKTSECVMPAGPRPRCSLKPGQYNLYFSQQSLNPIDVETDFEEIWSENGPVYIGPTGSNMVSVEREGMLYFRFRQDVSKPIPSQNELRSGGICIIDILTEPCPWCPPSTRPLRAFENLHPIRP
jgi:hypothetical protein